MSQDTRVPKYGDEVFVPSEHEDGHWVNAIVNAEPRDGKMIVAATGHRYANLVLVTLADYPTAWCWPEDIGAQASGAKMATLGDVTG